ncbi:MAG: bifunctional metallophosphatase/5'-nucleotidase [Okeania sp. SIO2F4]|uniref:5'-nucleotidase C-terminal domain-containing protein n=1 Tax=Okeania sp. SIO2F4 TaxID=2607790 RepID=UPI00142B55CB|nr:5'-nucleotidase C-terminal domain-containing protein [Okeania sp. SIO2F4]NES04032.1 bifunctional metallophosphatase/5'-nucleotidase [Okeania sp. SIO2F4]
MEPIQLQILHAADQEGGIPAIQDAVNFSAVINALDDDFENTLKLSSGDIYIPGPFFNASDEVYGEPGIGDILINNALEFQAVAFGNHEFDQGTETIANLIAANPEITGPGIGEDGYLGTQFPYLSTNIDFGPDENLAGFVVADGGTPEPNTISGSIVIEVGGEEIGIVGATTPTLPSIASTGDVVVSPTDSDDIEALAEIIQETVDELTATGINKIVLLTHMQQISIEEQLAEILTDVDVIIPGGSNTLLAAEDDILRDGDERDGQYPLEFTSPSDEPVLVINTDGNYKYVGRLIANFDENGIITSFDEDLSGAYATDDEGVDRAFGEDVEPENEADPTVVAVTNAINENISDRDGNIFGATDVFLNGTRGNVRTEETNLGNLTADANLFIAQEYDSDVVVSIKNGGGIRDNIGQSFIPPGGTSDDLVQLPPAGNPFVGKEEGQISQLDIENTLRFNNELTLLTVTAEELKQIIEHGVAATADGATPGQFPQVGGISFSFDATQQAIEFNEDADGNLTGVATDGERVRSLAIIDQNGAIADVVVRNGEIVGDSDREIRLVTLNFLAGGGDSYPFPLFGENEVELVDEVLPADATNNANFTDNGSEQDALAEFLSENFPADGNPSFTRQDVPPEEDRRIQNLSARQDTVLTIRGNGDDGRLVGSGAEDTIIGGTGNESLFGRDSDDLLQGRLGFDHLFGGDGDDTLNGGQGRDRLNSGPGDDEMTGGASIDYFIFNTNQAYSQDDLGEDTITDFDVQRDIILLDRTTFTAIEDGANFNEIFATVTSDAAAAINDVAIVYNTNNGNLFYNQNGNDAGLGSGGLFVTLDSGLTLDADNFVFRG